MGSGRLLRAIRIAALVLGTGCWLPQIATSCDPQVRSTILGGFQSLANSFIDAFFVILNQQGTFTPVTV